MKPNLLRLVQEKRSDTVPPGWVSCAEIAKDQGYDSVESFRPVLRESLKLKLVESRKFRVINARGLSMVPHYRYAKGY